MNLFQIKHFNAKHFEKYLIELFLRQYEHSAIYIKILFE